MFGTGELASSSSESTRPSWTYSSCTVGTYCRQMGSWGDSIKSTIAWEIRNSKFSTACFRRSISATCSAPNRSARASRDAILRLRSRSCQVSIREILAVDHQIVTGRVVLRDGRGPGVAAVFVKGPRRRVVGSRAGFRHDQSPARRPQAVLHFRQKLRADPLAVARGIHDEPVQVGGPLGPGRRTPANAAGQRVAPLLEGAEPAVIVLAGQGLVQHLDGGLDLGRPEHPGRPDERLNPPAVRAIDGAQRAAHARPSPPGRRGAPPRRSAAPARGTPTPRPAPSATARRRRSGRGWG